MDYELKLMQILECIGINEGTVFSINWEMYGVSEDETQIILSKFDKHRGVDTLQYGSISKNI